jgi:hypothetical protein
MVDLLANPIKKAVRMVIVFMGAIEYRDGSGLDMVEIGNGTLELTQPRVMQGAPACGRHVLQIA